MRPREKLLQNGAEALSDTELLAIFLRTGSTGMPVMLLAQHMLVRFGSLYDLMTASEAAMSQVKGVGPAKFVQLRAVAELARRFFGAQLVREDVIKNPASARDYLQSMLAHQERELFMVLFLDNQNRLLAAEQMFAGSINSVEIHPREILREALKRNAAALILAHNHPSGIAEPSRADREITRRICQAATIFNISVLDHLVVGHGHCVSFAERGWL